MSEWTNKPKETYPLCEKTRYTGSTLENSIAEKDGGTTSFPRSQSPQLGFIYPPYSRLPADDPYATQPAYNPSYKSREDAIIAQTNEVTEHERNSDEESVAKEGENSASDTEDDSTESYVCAIIIIIVIILICAIIYFAVKHQKLAKSVHTIVTETKKQRENEESTNLLKKVLNPVVTGEIVNLLNESRNKP